MGIFRTRAKARLTPVQRITVIRGLNHNDRLALLEALVTSEGPAIDYALEHVVRVRSIAGGDR